MRPLLLAVAVMLSLAACGKKKSPQTPADTQTQTAPEGTENEEQNVTTPENADGADTSDPCEGGE